MNHSIMAMAWHYWVHPNYVMNFMKSMMIDYRFGSQNIDNSSTVPERLSKEKGKVVLISIFSVSMSMTMSMTS